MPAGRPPKEFDKKQFEDLIGIGCSEEEICWWFRDASGKPANVDTLSRWCKRTFGENFHDHYKKCGGMVLKIKLRRNQLKLSEKSPAMAIWLGKQYLNQTDAIKVEGGDGLLADLIDGLKKDDIYTETTRSDAVMADEPISAN